MPFIGNLFVCPRSGRFFVCPQSGRFFVCPSGCWLSAPRSAGCRPQGAGCLPSELFVLHERPLSPSRCHLSPFPSTKMPILCSKCPKTGVPEGKSAQKPRFCARNARKWGFQSQKAHKNLDFVLETPENEGPEAKKRTKTSILCSKCPKTGVPKSKSAQKPRFCAQNTRKIGVLEGKSAQKPRFCARNARKRGFRRLKAHKNLDFVLEMPENGGSEGQKSTKTPILCSGRLGLAPGREEIGIGKHNRGDVYRKRGLSANHRARFKNVNAS